jgi:hypothetical protein
MKFSMTGQEKCDLSIQDIKLKCMRLNKWEIG